MLKRISILMLAMLVMRLFRIPFFINLDGEPFLEGSGMKAKLKRFFLSGAKAYLVGRATVDQRQQAHRYSVAKCLKCGLCLEVCPNYRYGGEFYGAILANESYLLTSQSATKDPRLIGAYQTHFGAGCSKALSCQSVCPMGIETISSIMKMNRQ